MSSKVFGISLRTHYRESLSAKMLRLFQSLKPAKSVQSGSLWAIKLHFGERGGDAFIRPHLVRTLVDALKEMSAKPYLTDTNTLYVGGRTNSADHLETAISHGFDYSVVGAPLIIADGLRGASEVEVEINAETGRKAYIASDFFTADGTVVLSHVKGHELTGFGGALKNLGMGAASRRGKMEQHCDLGPKVTAKKCIGCRRCLSQCAHKAISLNKAKKAAIDPQKCVGCAGCIPICPEGAIDVQWNGDPSKFMKKMVEYSQASLKGKEGRAFFINFITNVSPLCDCVNHSDAPIVPDLGILASHDPVALDMASAELVNNSPGLSSSALPQEALAAGADKWEALHPGCQWPLQLELAEQLGLGSRKYDLVWLPEVKGILN